MGVGRPCPPVRNDIVTPRHLFVLQLFLLVFILMFKIFLILCLRATLTALKSTQFFFCFKSVALELIQSGQLPPISQRLFIHFSTAFTNLLSFLRSLPPPSIGYLLIFSHPFLQRLAFSLIEPEITDTVRWEQRRPRLEDRF